MKIDKELAKEIKKANGDGSREAKFAFLHKIIAVKEELSTTKVRDTFVECFKHHERAAIAVCVAATIWERRDRLGRNAVMWATEVLKCWTNRPASGTARIIIEDNLHPTRIEEYAGSFIRLTTEDI